MLFQYIEMWSVLHLHIQILICAHTYIYIHTNKYLCIYLHTHTHTYIYIYYWRPQPLNSFFPSFLLTFLHSVLPSFRPSVLHSFTPSFLLSFLPQGRQGRLVRWGWRGWHRRQGCLDWQIRWCQQNWRDQKSQRNQHWRICWILKTRAVHVGY